LLFVLIYAIPEEGVDRGEREAQKSWVREKMTEKGIKVAADGGSAFKRRMGYKIAGEGGT